MIEINSNLSKNKYISQRFVILNSNTGQLTLPNFSNLILGGFTGGKDGLIVTTIDNYPTGINAVDIDNNPINVTIDTFGNFSFNTPIDYPVALIYQVEQFFKDYNANDGDIINIFHADIYLKLKQKILTTTQIILSDTNLNFNNSSLMYSLVGDDINFTTSNSIFNLEERYQVYRNGQVLRKGIDVIYVNSNTLRFPFDLDAGEELIAIT
jgi:hypothetical protein